MVFDAKYYVKLFSHFDWFLHMIYLGRVHNRVLRFHFPAHFFQLISTILPFLSGYPDPTRFLLITSKVYD